VKIRLQLSGTPITLAVPEGVDPQEFASRVEEAHYAQEKPSAASDSNLENFSAGVGHGAVNMGKQALNMALPDQLTPDFASDKSLEEAKVRDEGLMGTKAGMLGDMVGTTLATAPVGSALGVASKVGTTLATAPVGSALGVASKVGNVLARTLANPAARAAVDNAVTGALAAGPGDRMSGAVTGAAISGAFTGAGKVLKRTLMRPWAEKTAAAKFIEGSTGHEIPLSQSAKPGLMKQIYEGVVANMPGSADKIRGQYDNALEDFRHFIVEEASPPGTNRIPSAGDDMQTIMGNLRKAWEDRYASHDYPNAPVVMFSHLYKPPTGDFGKELVKRLPVGVSLPKVDSQITGARILSTKDAVQKVIDELPDKETILKSKFLEFKDNLDHVLKQNIDPSGRGKGQWASELRDVEALKPYYRKFKDIEAAAGKAAHASEFSPANLEAATTQRAGNKGIVGGGAFADEAKHSVDALRPFPSRQGIFQTRAAMAAGAGTVGATIGGVVAGPIGAAVGGGAPVALSRVLASPKTQRILTGDTKTQKLMAAALRRNKDKLNAASSVARKVLTIGATEDR
jgi:hypothetical protein